MLDFETGCDGKEAWVLRLQKRWNRSLSSNLSQVQIS